MVVSTINWRTVRHRALDLDIRTDRALAQKAGLHYNSIGKEGPYMSTTLDKLAALFECHPCDLIKVDGAQTLTKSQPD